MERVGRPLAAGVLVLLVASVLLVAVPQHADAIRPLDPRVPWFAEHGVDQPFYSQITQPQAMYAAAFDRTYVTYFGGTNGSIYVTYFDHRGMRWHSPAWVASTDGMNGHKGASVWVSAAGHVHVFCCSHDNALHHYRSVRPDGMLSFERMADPTPVATYPNVIEHPAGTLWLFYRDGAAAGGGLAYRTSEDGGVSWTAAKRLIDYSMYDGQYWGKWALAGDRLYLPWVRYHAATNTREDVYVCYLDLSTRIAHSLAGADLGTRIDRQEAETACKVRDTALPTRTNHPALDVVDGDVHLLWIEGYDDGAAHAWGHWWARWDGEAWSAPELLVTTDAMSNYADLRVLGRDRVEAFLTTAGVDHGCLGDCEYSGDLERWRWDGASWARVGTILSEVASGDGVNHPYVPLFAREEIHLVFDEFQDVHVPPARNTVRLPGTARLYAWGSSGFVQTSATSNAPAIRVALGDVVRFDDGTEPHESEGERVSASESLSSPARWKYVELDDGPKGCAVATYGGSFHANWSGGGTGRKSCLLRATWGLAGDFDIRLRFLLTDRNEAGTLRVNLGVNDVPDFVSASRDGGHYSSADGLTMQRFIGSLDLVRTFDTRAGVSLQLGGDTATTSTWLRIVRLGDTFASYLSRDGVTWTLDESARKAGTGETVYVAFGVVANGVTYGSVAVEFLGLEIASGSVAEGGSDAGRATASHRDLGPALRTDSDVADAPAKRGKGGAAPLRMLRPVPS